MAKNPPNPSSIILSNNPHSNFHQFNNEEFGSVRTIEIDGEIWFVGIDVARALGHKNPERAIRKFVDDEDKGVTELVTPGGKQVITIINESGMYSLILSSKLESAKRFKRWVTSEILPSIRKSGAYSITNQNLLKDMNIALKEAAEYALHLQSFGIDKGLAQLDSLSLASELYGVDLSRVQKMLPEADVDEPFFYVSEITDMLGWKNGAVNQRLCDIGFQVWVAKGTYKLTEKGIPYGKLHQYSNHGHKGTTIIWKESIIPILKKVFPLF